MIYLDNHATTRCDPRVVEAMLPWFSEEYGNANSVGHSLGEAARGAVDSARETIADTIGASPDEVLFTSGATESNNLAIRGVAERQRRRGDHLVSVTTEHRAVLEPLERLAKAGRAVDLLAVDGAGLLDPAAVADAIGDETCLVSVMLANNEIGVVQPLAEIAAACRERGVLLHCDATQAVGKLPVDVDALGVDLMSFTAHKLYGPKGIGALYVRGRAPVVRLDPQITGGGQQRGRRSGTLNVPGIVGFAEALRLCKEEMSTESARLARLRDELWESLRLGLPDLQICGPALDATDAHGRLRRLPHNLTVAVPGIDGEAVVMRLDGVAISSGAACSADEPGPSHVLRALGMAEDQARGSLRFGLGRFTTAADTAEAARQVVAAVRELREIGV